MQAIQAVKLFYVHSGIDMDWKQFRFSIEAIQAMNFLNIPS